VWGVYAHHLRLIRRRGRIRDRGRKPTTTSTETTTTTTAMRASGLQQELWAATSTALLRPPFRHKKEKTFRSFKFAEA